MFFRIILRQSLKTSIFPPHNNEIDSNCMPRVDVEAIMEEATSNPAVAENLNSKIDELAGGTTNISGIISSIGGQLGLE